MEGFPNSGREKLRQELADGLLYIHSRLSENTKSTLEAASFLYALVELLSEQGLISIDKFEERKTEVAQGLAKKILKTSLGKGALSIDRQLTVLIIRMSAKGLHYPTHPGIKRKG